MTDETTPKTAEETLQEKLRFHDLTIEELQLALALKPDLKNILEAMKEYSRQEQRRVAQQVRQQCAEKAKIGYSSCGDAMNCGCQGNCDHPIASIRKESILSVDIEAFIK